MLSTRTIRIWSALHKWSSLVCTVFMLLLCLTGLPLIFHHELGHILGTEVEAAQLPADTPHLSLDRVLEIARSRHPDRIVQYASQEPDSTDVWFVTMTPTPAPTDDFKQVAVDARTGVVLARPPLDQGFLWVVNKLHVDLFAGLPGKLFLGAMGILLLVAIVTGVVLYAPFMRKLGFGEVRTGRAQRVRWLDLHNLLGIVTLAWLFVVGAMHMLQHQAGAAVRIDVNKFNELLKENGILARELGKAQERCTRVITEKTAEIEQLNAQLVQQRANVISKESRITFLAQDLELLKASLPDFENISRLHKKIEQLLARQNQLEGQNAQMRHQLGEAQRSLTQRLKADASVPTQVHLHDAIKEAPITFHLNAKTVLCVGGRNGNVANYRDVIERAGGHFAHHDGGLEDNQGALDSVLAAADLVICQTGCISHNAYWRVKDFCKRTGKQCVFVENPSTSSLARSLQQIAVDDKTTQTPENLSA